MQLQLLDGDGKFVCEMDNDTAVLGSYPVENGHKIHVCDHECTDFLQEDYLYLPSGERSQDTCV